MKQFNKQLYMLLIVCISIAVQAQNFHVVDINRSKDANPTDNTQFDNDWGHADTYYAIYNGISYFSADDGIHGAELWRSDGTSAGTYMIKDINPGIPSSNVRAITVSGSKIFFSATDGINVQEIWVTNGTEQGTQPVIDLGAYGSSNPTSLTDVNGVLYFFTNQLLNGSYTITASQLWKSDATASGTTMVADFYNNPSFNYGSNGAQITNVNGRVFFSLYNYGNANELFTSDGTTGGTLMLNNINTNGWGSSPSYLTSLNGRLYFSANNGNGINLWVSDGSFAGTYEINNNNNIYLDNDTYYRFPIKNNTLYFTGYSSDGDGTELCKYDISNAANNVEVVKDVNPGAFNNNLYNIINVNGTLYFTVYSGIDQTLWKSDGTTAGTVQVKDINPGGHNIYFFRHFINANGTLLFSFYDDAHGYELWKSDGTCTGTVMVKEINPGIYSAQVQNITYVGMNISLFEASDGKNGLELWRTDGTAHGTWMVKNINQSSSASSDPYWITPAPDNKSLIFSAFDPEYGREIRISDGTDAGTHVIKDIYKGSFDSWPYLPANLKNTTYFFANIDNPVPRQDHGSDVFLVSRLWKTDGTREGTFMLSVPALETLINGLGYVASIVSTDNLLYLVIFNYATNEYELWRSDGTGPGTYAIKTDISNYYNPILTAVGKILFFTSFDNINGYRLWETDGSSTCTKPVPLSGGSSPQNFYSFKNKLYFTAYDASYNNDLWVSNGTPKGTKIISTVNVANWIPFAQANGKLFFTADDHTTTAGFELWATDGTKRGTKLVRDIYPGDYNSSFPSILTSAGSFIYFTAYENIHGYEIWKSDGTAHGTQLVKDITPGIDGSYGVHYLTNLNGRLYFLNADALWTSDGTSNGTNQVNDGNLKGVSGLGNITAFGDQLAFTAFAPATGQELYVGNFRANTCARIMSAIMPSIESKRQAFSTTLYPNPASSKATLEITGNPEDVSVTIADMNGRVIWQNSYNNQSRIDLPVEKLSAGMYVVTIKHNNNFQTIKLFKN